MIQLVFAAQQFLNTQHAARLVEDGIPGPRTETAQRASCSLTRRGIAGCIPTEWGQASTYGGPTDYGDLYEGQSFFPIADPDGSGPKPAMYTPKRYYNEICKPWQRELLNPVMGTLDRWPILRGKAVGVSYFLRADEVPGFAVRLSGDALRRARAGEVIMLRVYNPAIVINGEVLHIDGPVIDWGPIRLWSQSLWESAGKPAGVVPGVTPWRFKIDMLPFAYRSLQLKTGADRVWWEVL